MIQVAEQNKTKLAWVSDPEEMRGLLKEPLETGLVAITSDGWLFLTEKGVNYSNNPDGVEYIEKDELRFAFSRLIHVLSGVTRFHD